MQPKEIKAQIIEKVFLMNREFGAEFPNITENGHYVSDNKSFWTKGFWPGILWNVYQETKDETFRNTAIQIENKLDNVLQDFYPIHHDAGFVWSLTSVANYRLTGNEVSRRRALTAASHLAGRFNLKGGFIRAWNDTQGKGNQGWAIIDCLMNLPLLYWASEETGDPRFRHIAMAHADTVIKEFSKADGSTYHIVCFNPETGVRIGYRSGQGATEDSAWARGQSWILYGMALSYRYTKEARYLRASVSAADFFVNNLPEDAIPYWDFKVPRGKDVPRDTSAAACAACGLLELAQYVEPKKAVCYTAWAERMIQALYEKWWLSQTGTHALLGGATFNYPAEKGINVSLIYGDYFYTEAVMRLAGDSVIFW
ncbi:MAG: glycoside hydrolase family 88 protein [Ruthenibacterium sp.]